MLCTPVRSSPSAERSCEGDSRFSFGIFHREKHQVQEFFCTHRCSASTFLPARDPPGCAEPPPWCGSVCPAALPRVSVEFLSLVTSHPGRALVAKSGLSQWRCPREHAARRAAGTSAPSAPGCPAGTQPAGGGKKIIIKNNNFKTPPSSRSARRRCHQRRATSHEV